MKYVIAFMGIVVSLLLVAVLALRDKTNEMKEDISALQQNLKQELCESKGGDFQGGRDVFGDKVEETCYKMDRENYIITSYYWQDGWITNVTQTLE